MPRERSPEEARAEARVVRRARVLRWLVRRLSDDAVRMSSVPVADANNTKTWELRGRIQILSELVDTFTTGRER